MRFAKADYFTWLLSAFVFLLPWQTRYIFGTLQHGSAVSEYGIMSLYASQLLLIAGLMIGYLWRGRPIISEAGRSLVIGAGGLVLVALVGLVFSTERALSLAQFIHLGSAFVVFLALLDSRVDMKRVLASFILGLVLPLLLGAFQVLAGYTPSSTLLGLAVRNAEHLGDSVISLPDGARMLRAYGSFSHPNVFGGYLAVGVVVAGALWSKAKSLRYRSVYGVLAVVLMLGLFLTASRSAALGLALGACLSLLVVRTKNMTKTKLMLLPVALLAIGLTLAFTLLAPQLVAGTRGGGVNEERSIRERTAQYSEFLMTVKKASPLRVLVGHGASSYTFELAKTFPGRAVFAYQPVHSVPLLVFFEFGLIGTLLILSWWLAIGRLNTARFPNRDAVAALAVGNVVLVVIFFDHYLLTSWSGLALLAMVAALLARLGEPTSAA